MNPKVAQYLEAKEREAAAKAEAEKKKILLDAGLFEREYTDANNLPGYEAYDATVGKFYRDVPIEVTEEEYRAILAHYNESADESERKRNTMSTVFLICGWIVIVTGVIAVFAARFPWGAGGLVSGLFMLGMAEIIQQLDDIRHKD